MRFNLLDFFLQILNALAHWFKIFQGIFAKEALYVGCIELYFKVCRSSDSIKRSVVRTWIKEKEIWFLELSFFVHWAIPGIELQRKIEQK